MEAGIKSGKIQKDASSATVRKPFIGKKEVSVVYPQRNQDRTKRRPMVGDIMIPNPAPTQQRNDQPRIERPVRQFTRISMTMSKVLPHLLKTNLETLKEAPKNPNTASPRYNPNSALFYPENPRGRGSFCR